jgi:hypothetical protein
MSADQREAETMELAARVRSWDSARVVDHKPFVCGRCKALTSPYYGDYDGFLRFCQPCWDRPWSPDYSAAWDEAQRS